LADEVVATISMSEANSCNFREIMHSKLSLNWGIGLGRTKPKRFRCESSFVVD
jgi:hypothetical protein